MTDIFTITLNPALDISTAVDQVRPGPKLRCDAPQADPGGGGINVSRAIRRLGGDSLAFVALGGATGQRLASLLTAEGLRFDELAVRAGVSGILRVMKQLGMLKGKALRTAKVTPAVSESSYWLRAPAGGVLRAFKTIGESVAAGDLVGIISDPFGESDTEVLARDGGLIIGRTNLPVVNQGDGLIHVARVKQAQSAEARVGRIEAELQSDPLFDEDEII